MATPLELWESKYEKSKEKIDNLKYSKKFIVLVGSATCENAAGATKLLELFRNKLADNNDVYVGITGCTGRCSKEPIVQIIEKGRLPIKYCQIKIDDVDKLINEHIKNGRIVNELLLTD